MKKNCLPLRFGIRFAEHLAYDQRDIEEEINLIEVTRSQMARILRLEIGMQTGPTP